MKEFNTTAVCIPTRHYMVDISERVKEIKKLVDKGEYFTINRARQYGKTTTLNALAECLQKDYYVLGLDFQNIGDGSFRTEELFVQAFSRLVLRKRYQANIPEEICVQLKEFVQRREDKALEQRSHPEAKVFRCVILVGVTEVKHLKRKRREEVAAYRMI